jgi:hypothetical protein
VSERTTVHVMLAGVLAVTLALSACGSPQPASAQDWQTITSSRRTAGEEQLRVTVEYGAGTLRLGAGEAGTLYRSELRYDAAVFTPVVDYSDGRLRFGMTGAQMRGRNIRGGELDLRLSPDVPLDLNVQFGAADATLDLGGLRVRRLDVQTGASRTSLTIPQPNEEPVSHASIQVGAARFEASGLGNLNAERLRVQGGVGEVILDFTGTWPADMTANVEMGLGSLTVRLPRGLGVRVVRGGALTRFDGQELIRRGDTYYSQDWDSAARKLSLHLDAALGSIRVVWVDS